MKINEILTERISSRDLSSLVTKAVHDAGYNLFNKKELDKSMDWNTNNLDFEPKLMYSEFSSAIIKSLKIAIAGYVNTINQSDLIYFHGIGTDQQNYVIADSEDNMLIDNKIPVSMYLDNKMIYQLLDNYCQSLLAAFKESNKDDSIQYRDLWDKWSTTKSFYSFVSSVVHELTHVIQFISMARKFSSVEDFHKANVLSGNKKDRIRSNPAKDILQHHKHFMYPHELDAYAKEITASLISVYEKAIKQGSSELNAKKYILDNISKFAHVIRPELTSYNSQDKAKRKLKNDLFKRIYQDISEYFDNL